jgi:hypothetical protein
MKNKFSNGRMSYFYTPRIHGNVLAWVKPASESEGSKRVIENILRWEDDGGPVSETGSPLPQVAEIKTPRMMDADGESLL